MMSSDNKKPQIKPIPDGPCEVKEIREISSKDGSIEIESTAYLCRCGQSMNKPFCDGKHKETNFDSSKEEDRVKDHVRDYKGKELTVHFNRGVCAHVGHCLRNLSPVFDLDSKPWIQPDNASAEEVIRIVNECPSGALSYSVEGVHFPEDQESEACFIVYNGPLLVRGDIELENEIFGEGATPKKYALCRCGKSKNKPFCDGAHLKYKFE
jgi:CDGSH-type Zn-finger protein